MSSKWLYRLYKYLYIAWLDQLGTRKNVRVIRNFEWDDVFWMGKRRKSLGGLYELCDNSSCNCSSYAEFTVCNRTWPYLRLSTNWSKTIIRIRRKKTKLFKYGLIDTWVHAFSCPPMNHRWYCIQYPCWNRRCTYMTSLTPKVYLHDPMDTNSVLTWPHGHRHQQCTNMTSWIPIVYLHDLIDTNSVLTLPHWHQQCTYMT